MERVYSGILQESLDNMEQIFTVIESYSTSMSDAERLTLINEAADRIDANYDDLRLFNQQNVLLTLQRAKSKKEVEQMRRLYGIAN
jgi:flagellar biosynthesis/type III secretory pathway chaperone